MRLYTQPLPDRTLQTESRLARQQVAAQGTLDGGAAADAIAALPGDERLQGAYRGRDATHLARSLRELADAPGYDAVPLYDPDGASAAEGYYVVEEAEPETPVPGARAQLQGFRLGLSSAGTRRSQYRRLATEIQSRTQDFSTSTEEREVRLPAVARRVRWWDGTTATQSASPMATESAARGDLEVYDLTASPYSEATLLYDLPYAEEGRVDCTVWRTHGRASLRDANDVVQWSRLFDPAAAIDDAIVCSTRRLRVRIDDAAETISAEQYDASASAWSDTALGTSSWAPIDLDLRVVGPARIAARTTFSDGSSEYTLDLVFPRGRAELSAFRTPNATSSTPQGLLDLLDPIAATTIYDVETDRGLVGRTEVSE